MKQILTLLLAAILLLTCGCSLAQPAPETDPIVEDRLIGVLITTQYLDLFDMEAWLNDNINRVALGGETVIDGDTSRYKGRIYAQRVEEEYVASDGVTRTRIDFQFPEELKGEALICPTLTDERGEHYTASINGHIFSNTHTHIKGNDAATAIELTATVYYDPLTIQRETVNALYEDGTEGTEEHICFYHNPVYQTDAGDVYVTSGSGHSYSVSEDMSIYGMNGTYYIDQTFITNVNGEVNELTNKVSITMEAVRYARKIVILNMSKDNKILQTMEYDPQDFPNKLIVSSDTAYVIVETHSLDEHDNEVIGRQVCTTNAEDEHFDVFVPVGNGYISKQETKVVTA